MDHKPATPRCWAIEEATQRQCNRRAAWTTQSRDELWATAFFCELHHPNDALPLGQGARWWEVRIESYVVMPVFAVTVEEAAERGMEVTRDALDRLAEDFDLLSVVALPKRDSN